MPVNKRKPWQPSWAVESNSFTGSFEVNELDYLWGLITEAAVTVGGDELRKGLNRYSGERRRLEQW